MKKLLVCFYLYCYAGSNAQNLFPVFKSLRYDEDYSFLKKDSTRSLYQKLKYNSPGKSNKSYVSLGGEIRYQYFNIQNEKWGTGTAYRDDYLLSRALMHADVHLSRNMRIFFQLQSSMVNNKKTSTTAVEENPLDLHQVFLELYPANKKISVRIGRQEMCYGSQRLVAVRELPNNRQSFDAIKLISSFPHLSVDGFYSHYVIARKGLFDDAPGNQTRFWGVYLTSKHLLPTGNIDLYYLGLKKEKAGFNDGTGKELRHSMGGRFWKEKESWQYDLEGLYQFGDFAGKKISAWTISVNTGYRFLSWLLQPQIGLKTELISGDKKIADDQLQTFNPLFPKGAYFGRAAIIGPVNLVDIHPSINLRLWKEKLDGTLEYIAFWRHSASDGIYGPNVMLLFPSNDVADKFIGNQFATNFDFHPNAFVLVRTDVTWFIPGAYLKTVSAGKNILIIGITTQVKF